MTSSRSCWLCVLALRLVSDGWEGIADDSRAAGFGVEGAEREFILLSTGASRPPGMLEHSVDLNRKYLRVEKPVLPCYSLPWCFTSLFAFHRSPLLHGSHLLAFNILDQFEQCLAILTEDGR